MKKYLCVCLVIGGLGGAKAQTTLSGDHIVDGDLTIGTSANRSQLVINGAVGSSATPSLLVDGDGGVSFGGALGVGVAPTLASGSKMIWYPAKAAFRVGYSSASLQDSDIGAYSLGVGKDALASGSGSVSFGENSQALGDNSLAVNGGLASGESSIAFGYGWSDAYMTFAGPGSVALAEGSVAFGWSEASGRGSTALSGGMSLAPGSVAVAQGISAGVYTMASGNCAVAVSFGSFVIGQWNVIEGDSSKWVETDPIFVIGNGTGDSSDPPEVQYRNAFTVYKNGKVKMVRQGDILMGEFGNPE